MSAERPIRVLVVDDSAFARKVLREVLAADPRLQVLGVARDGLEALERIGELAPDVVTLDLMMPQLDGVGVLRALGPGHAPRIVVVSASDEQSEVVVEALALGAFDFVRKPTSLASDRLYELGAELAEKVAAAGRPRRAPPAHAPRPAAERRVRGTDPSPSVVVIGTSTGGPQALARVIPALPRELPVPVVIALHIPAEYTPAMAARLDQDSAIRVAEAHDGAVLAPGTALLAPGGADLALAAGPEGVVARIGFHAVRPYHPSVDVLFESAARVYGAGVLGVVLTGMGDDGLEGARAIHAAGGHLVVEAEDTSVVWGMPRAVHEAGLADAVVPLEGIAGELARRTRG